MSQQQALSNSQLYTIERPQQHVFVNLWNSSANPQTGIPTGSSLSFYVPVAFPVKEVIIRVYANSTVAALDFCYITCDNFIFSDGQIIAYFATDNVPIPNVTRYILRQPTIITGTFTITPRSVTGALINEFIYGILDFEFLG